MAERDNIREGIQSDQGRMFLIVETLFFVLALVCVGLRVWGKHLKRRDFDWHDYTMFSACMVTCCLWVDTVYLVKPGALGMHIEDVMKNNPGIVKPSLIAFFVAKLLWLTSTTLTKLSILHLQCSIFSTQNFKIQAIVVAAFCGLFYIAYILETFLICRPFAFTFDKQIQGGHCGNEYADIIGPAAVNMILDLIITLLPMAPLWRLQMPLVKKISSSIVLGCGIAICAMNITRIATFATQDIDDFTYALISVCLFGALEVYVGIMAGCMPTFGPIIWSEKITRRRQKHSLFSSQRYRPRKMTESFGSLSDDQYPLSEYEQQKSTMKKDAMIVGYDFDEERATPKTNVIMVQRDVNTCGRNHSDQSKEAPVRTAWLD